MDVVQVQEFLGLFTLQTPYGAITAKVEFVMVDRAGRPIFLKTNEGVVWNWTNIISMTPQER